MFFFDENKTLTFPAKSIESGYLSILENNLEMARIIFESVDSPRARWGKAFCDILTGYIERMPTYFEIRNFLEIDLDFLIKNEKLDYVEQFLGSLKHLIEINQETYKYVARVFLENRLYNVAKEFLEKSKHVFYKDPELHFLFTKFYINSRDYERAMTHIEECLQILPDYYPAKILKKELEKFIKS